MLLFNLIFFLFKLKTLKFWILFLKNMQQNGIFGCLTIHRNKKTWKYLMLFLNNNFFPKSQKGNEIWTFLKMSRNWKPKIVLKMGQKCDCDDYDHLYFFCEKNL